MGLLDFTNGENIFFIPVDDKISILSEKVQCYVNLVSCHGRYYYTQLYHIIKSYVHPVCRSWVVREKYFSKCA